MICRLKSKISFMESLATGQNTSNRCYWWLIFLRHPIHNETMFLKTLCSWTQRVRQQTKHYDPLFLSLSTTCSRIHIKMERLADNASFAKMGNSTLPCGGYNSYPLFADGDTGIYPHAASQYHARPKFIHTQHRNTTRGRRPSVVLRCCVWINSRIRVSKQGVTNLSHAQTIFVTFWNVSAALKSQLSH